MELLANTLESDQTAPQEQLDLGLYCLIIDFCLIFMVNMAVHTGSL